VRRAHVIGCDVGSQGTNAALYSDDGALVATHYEPHNLSWPRPLWAEQDPGEWTKAVIAAVGRVARAADGPDSIKGLSFGSQLDGMVVCDDAGRPLRPALIWMDRRAEAQAARLAKKMAREDFYRHSGTNLDSSHAVFKALWVRDEEPELFERAGALMPPGTFVLKEVTGVAAVDPSNASSLGLLDPRTRSWSEELLDVTEIDVAMLPEIRAATDSPETVTKTFADATGLDPGTVVATGCGDEMAATLGAGVFEPGEVCDVVGTAEPVCAASDTPKLDDTMLVECHPHADPDGWLLENPGFVSGGNLRWWRDNFAPLERHTEAAGLADAYDLLSGEAAKSPPGAGGITFLPCMQGAMAPEWNGAARGVFYGLTLAHTRDHLTRAVLEGSAFALRDIIEAMKRAGLEVRRLTIVGGGAKGTLWRQIKSDVTGLPARVPINVETTATGAAMLAAVAAGLFSTVAEATDAFVSFLPEEHEPDPAAGSAYEEAYARYGDVYDSLRGVFERRAEDG
jgi:xylulokinase